MGTAETIIVFAALMALIALVTIGLDWIGKPLKHRRFIPRLYRFEDEKLPIDEYGHTDFAIHDAPAAQPFPVPYMQPAPVMVPPAPNLATSPPQYGTKDTVAVPVAEWLAPDQDDDSDFEAEQPAAAASAFSDSLQAPPTPAAQPSTAFSDAESWLSGAKIAGATRASATTGASTTAAPAASSSSLLAWRPGVPLDATVDDRKPNLATKAQRFWKSTAELLQDSHFDANDLARMSDGKAPQRTNARTGRTETIQLTGLRQASDPADVGMRWPDDSIDPWSTT